MIVSKTKFRVWFFIKENEAYKLHKKKRFNPLKRKGLVYYKKVPYEPLLEHPTFENGKKQYFFFEIGKKSQITTYEISTLDSDAEIKDLLYIQEVMKQGFSAIKESGLKLNWIHLVLASFSFLLTGWILGNYVPIGVLP